MHTFKENKWIKTFIVCFVLFTLGIAIAVIVIDPYFHYHRPLDSVLRYDISNSDQRYVNDGIIRNFEYDGLITGTSMTENFSTSIAEKLFGGRFIKVPYAGATLCETRELLNAMRYNKPRYVICGIDIDILAVDKDVKWSDVDNEWLTDDSLFNDVSYLFNIDVLKECLKIVKKSVTGKRGMTDFDEYSSNRSTESSLPGIMEKRTPIDDEVIQYEVTDVFREGVKSNVRQNVVELTKAYPDTEFYWFLTTPSIVWYADEYAAGRLDMRLDSVETILDECVGISNLHIFCWIDEDLITELANYKDTKHYNYTVADRMLEWMAEGHGEVTIENLEEVQKRLKDFFEGYDYLEY